MRLNQVIHLIKPNTTLNLIKKLPFKEILIAKLSCRQPEHHTTIRAHNILAIFIIPPNILQDVYKRQI